ncbi:uncharacterized protein A1O9_07466 [Exophiala aquamarina CBS 119918]|uniref:Uncharacterized protein n=1 Tax=Exophiala aquamarina CBS 119918 TaxID=1182545 RepID=A0A072P7R3_9EURO|nr:uncharacterized protein A1O9_07466 [Exophiala aquamarina CBS 119918]KEF55886.1 hypothetical protein A1O9_07466 [Exophiala aquamarina CBS 119918]
MAQLFLKTAFHATSPNMVTLMLIQRVSRSKEAAKATGAVMAKKPKTMATPSTINAVAPTVPLKS